MTKYKNRNHLCHIAATGVEGYFIRASGFNRFNPEVSYKGIP